MNPLSLVFNQILNKATPKLLAKQLNDLATAVKILEQKNRDTK
jgi:hypothetical protein